MKRKALIIVENLPVPFDSRVWKEATCLRDANYQVTVLCPKGKGYTNGYEKIEGVHVYRHPMPREGIRHWDTSGSMDALFSGSSSMHGGYFCAEGSKLFKGVIRRTTFS